MKLIVLMSTYNGEKYLGEQIRSLLSQKLRADKIIIRDDGSSDMTMEILKDYSERYSFIEYYSGKNCGPGRSFFDLIRNCEEADYYALCDQDDYWFEDKLETAVEMLEKEDGTIPLLYAGRFILTDEKLSPLDSDISKLYSYTDFPHALMYHTAPGCTFVFNNEARKKIVEFDPEKEYMLIHDAVIHKVTALFGKVMLDETPHMYYRQHGDNAIGLTADKKKTFFNRIRNFTSGKIRNYRRNSAKSLLNVYGPECTEENRKLLEMVADYGKSWKLKRKLIMDKRFRTGTINDFFFVLLVLFNYI